MTGVVSASKVYENEICYIFEPPQQKSGDKTQRKIESNEISYALTF